MVAYHLNKFCDKLDLSLINNLDKTEKELLINASFSCLFEKAGDQDIASKILLHFKLIKIVKNSYVYIGNKNIKNNYQKLKRTGITTIPILDNEKLVEIQKEIEDTLLSFPEYNRDINNPHLDIATHKLVYVLRWFCSIC